MHYGFHCIPQPQRSANILHVSTGTFKRAGFVPRKYKTITTKASSEKSSSWTNTPLKWSINHKTQMKTTTPPPQNCPNNGMRKFSLMRLNTVKLFPSPVTNYFRSSGRKQHDNTEQCRVTERQSKDWSRDLGQKLCLPSKCVEKASHKCATLPNSTLRGLLLRSVEEKWS